MGARTFTLAEVSLLIAESDQPDSEYCCDHQDSCKGEVQISKSRTALVESLAELFAFVAHAFSSSRNPAIGPDGASPHGVYDPVSLASSNSYATRWGTVTCDRGRSASRGSSAVECRTYGAPPDFLRTLASLLKALGTDATLKPGWNVRENSDPPAFAWRIPGLKSETWGTHHLIQEVLTQTPSALGYV